MPVINRIPCPIHPDSSAIKDGRCRACKQVYRHAEYLRKGSTPEVRYQGARNNAKTRDIEFTLTFDEWCAIITQSCVYNIESTVNPEIRVGIDRRTPAEGYHRDNVQPCCDRHNRLKSDILTHDQTKATVARYSIPCGNAKRGRPRSSVHAS